jgi:hypothetical protein
MFYRGKDAAVVFWMIEGEETGVLVGRLIYQGSQPFAELVDPSARKLPLIQENLRLLEEGAAGRPPIYYHRGFVIAPN